jgi:hypothetical protein
MFASRVLSWSIRDAIRHRARRTAVRYDLTSAFLS